MDLVFLGGIALFWAAAAALVIGIDRLRPQSAKPLQERTGERS